MTVIIVLSVAQIGVKMNPRPKDDHKLMFFTLLLIILFAWGVMEIILN